MKRLFRLLNFICLLAVLSAAHAAHADSTSANKGYSLMSTGTNRGQWGIGLNNNFGIIDNNLGGYHTVNVGGSSNVVVSASDAQNIYHKLTGTLTGNIQYVLPDAGGIFIIDNETSGAFTVTVDNMLGGTGVVVAQGAVNIVYSDATNNQVLSANAVISGIISSANGGTGSAYFGVSGPTVARTYAFPDANSTVLTDNAAVTVPQGGSGVATLSAHGVVIGAGTSPVVVSGAGTTGQALISNGASADPTFQNIPASSAATTSAAGIVQLATTIVAKTGTDATQALTAASIAGNSSLTGNGYYTLPNGFTIEWGHYAGGANSPTITFPVSFAAAAGSVTANTDIGTAISVQITSISKTSFVGDQISGAGTNKTTGFYWMAVGY